jgi:hypothetical protein
MPVLPDLAKRRHVIPPTWFGPPTERIVAYVVLSQADVVIIRVGESRSTAMMPAGIATLDADHESTDMRSERLVRTIRWNTIAYSSISESRPGLIPERRKASLFALRAAAIALSFSLYRSIASSLIFRSTWSWSSNLFHANCSSISALA